MMVFTVWDICQDHNDPADWYVFKLGLWLDQPTILPPLLLQLPEQDANEGGHWGHCREIAWKETHLNAKVAFFTMMWQFKVFSHCIVEVYKWWTITILAREFDNSCQCSVWTLESVVTSVMVCQFKYLLSQQTWLGPGLQPSAFTTL